MIKKHTQQSEKEVPRRQSGAQSIRRTIAILRSVSKNNETGVRLSAIAKDVALPPPTVHRILTVLLEEEFLSIDSNGKLYHLGTELYSLGATTQQFSIRDRYHTALKRINAQIDHVIHLIIRSGNDGLCIGRVAGQSRVQILGFDVGERRLLGIGAAGQALLAFLPEKQREEIIDANSSGYLKYYGTEAEEVRTWIKSTREMKYSYSIHIVTPESIGVGVPIFNKNGRVVAAISMAGIISQMPMEKCREIAEVIQAEIAAVDPPPG